MTWRCWLGDTMTGLVDRPIDLPSFSWSVGIGDCSLATNSDKGSGTEEWSGVTVPWTAVMERDARSRSAALSPSRRFLALCWDDGTDLGAPVLWGAIGQRTDTWLDTSFSVDSPMAVLRGRIAVEEGAYGTGPGSTSPGSIRLTGLSLRAMACSLIRTCTGGKPGGALPIDLPYLGEAGANSREWPAYDAQNSSCADILEGFANEIGGPDMRFRPYVFDPQHIRLAFEAGGDGDPYIGQREVRTLTCFPGGGTIQHLTVDHAGPLMRVYGSGSGTDAAQLCHLSEDLSLVRSGDPWPIVESAASDPDVDSADVLASRTDATLASNSRPLIQISGKVDFADPLVPNPGKLWPGDMVDLAIDGFPTLPDGVHRCRLMQMSGDQSTTATLKFDVMDDPIY